MGLGMSVSNTRLSMLFSFTPGTEEGTGGGRTSQTDFSREEGPPRSLATFEVDPDDVVVAHQVAAGQQLGHLGGVRADHLAHPVAHDAVRAEAQAGVRVHPEHVLLRGEGGQTSQAAIFGTLGHV